MRYALVQDGQIVTYPYTYSMLRQAHPDTSFPREPGAWLADWGVVEVANSPQPDPSSIGVNVVEGEPALVNGAWTQTWVEAPATAEQIAERTRDAADEDARQEAKADTFVQNFINMTPAQVYNYVKTQGTTVAKLNEIVAKLAVMQLLSSRREYRE
jgi:hypothetical protein